MDIQHIKRRFSRVTSTSIFCGPNIVPDQTVTPCPKVNSDERSNPNVLHQLIYSR
ncbi:hypothetical protein PDIG_69300 [Penicillium digitatum PHI26]|uniref:Uncharacterized protein n=2 Tax=Penicillium digitatum TaxID=36651 RepID=K9FFC4_PEND2|nr:hypothetical protein PDIP_78590 [Penicillium digitatum Pd1]EKV06598.1 hypothetical protein PDIP_78590 [Penicillium digitatum Pd1]EKV08165.1 hypothetical protein PDIG_69300 [Penicillium digitatum PHI26]